MASQSELIDAGFAPEQLSGLWTVVVGTDEGTRLEEELRREMAPGHPLYAADVVAAAIRKLRKECIFWVRSERRWAWVHLTWQPEHPGVHWPSTVSCDDWPGLLAELLDAGRE